MFMLLYSHCNHNDITSFWCRMFMLFYCYVAGVRPKHRYLQSSSLKHVWHNEQFGKFSCFAHSLAGHGRQLVFIWVLEKPSGQHSHVCARVSLLKLPGGHNLQGNPARTRRNSIQNGRPTTIVNLANPFPDQRWEAWGDLVSYNTDPGSYMYHNHSLTCTCAVQQIKARFNLPFPSLNRPGVQSCLIPSQQTVPGSQSKHVSGQN